MATYLILYPRLSTRSKRAIERQTKSFGHPVHYRPTVRLVKRLAQEMNWSESQVRNQLQREREELIKRKKLSSGET